MAVIALAAVFGLLVFKARGWSLLFPAGLFAFVAVYIVLTEHAGLEDNPYRMRFAAAALGGLAGLLAQRHAARHHRSTGLPR